MPSTFTSNIRCELQATGENENSWGDKTNSNIQMLESAIAGAATITMTDSDKTLSTAFNSADEARNAILIIGGIQSQARNVIVPSVSKVYVVRNLTSGGFGVTIKTASGSGITIPNNQTAIVACDSSNVFSAALQPQQGAIDATQMSTAAQSWRLDQALGIGRSQAISPGYGSLGLDGTTGSFVTTYNSGAAVGTMSGTAVSYDFSAPTLPMTFSTNGAIRLQINNNGTAQFTGGVTVSSLASQGVVSGTAGTFAGAVSGTTGTFTGNFTGTTGAYSGALSAAGFTTTSALIGTSATFSGALSCTGLTCSSVTSSGAIAGTTGAFSGNISLIKTAAPTLTVGSGSSTGIALVRMQGANAAVTPMTEYVGGGGQSWATWVDGAGNYSLSTTNGNTLIGTTPFAVAASSAIYAGNPSGVGAFQIRSSVSPVLEFYAAGAAAFMNYIPGGGNNNLYWYTSNGAFVPSSFCMFLSSAGNLTTNGTVNGVSDERLKTDWRSMPTNFIERMAAVKCGAYKRIDREGEFVGVGAQSLQKVLPEAVVEEETDQLSKIKHLTVSYGNAALLTAIELCKEVTALRSELTALKGRLGG